MFKPVKMLRIQVLGLKKDRPQVVESLHELGLMHFEECRHPSLEAETASPGEYSLNEELLRLYAIRKILKPVPQGTPGVRQPARPLTQVLREAKSLGLEEKLGALQQETGQIQTAQAALTEARNQLQYFSHFHVDLAGLKADAVTVLAGLATAPKLPQIRGALAAISPRHQLVAKPHDPTHTVLLVAIEKGKETQVREALERLHVARLPLPAEPGKPAVLLENLKKRATALKARRQSIDQEIEAYSKKHGSQLEFLIESLEIEQQRHQVVEKFGRTKDAFALQGFVPAPQVPRLKETLEKLFGGRLVIREHETHEGPTLLDNPPFFGPFQFLLEFVSIPKSQELDPTILFSFALAVFYGAMLGDAGYGLLSLALAHLIVKKTEAGGLLNQVGKIWFYFGIPTFFFGIAYDEYFGFTHEHLLGTRLYHGLERMESVQTLLVLTILLGLATVMLGYFLGFVTEVMERNYKHAVGKLGWIGVLASGSVLTATLLFQVFGPENLMAAGAVFGASALAIVYAEGPLGLIEIPGVAGNILSYSRIAAVGLSSVIIALILNEQVLPKPEQGLWLIITLPLFLFGHLFNAVLGMFESLVQGSRLNFVEFFSKFHHGGGEKFAPFKCERKHTMGG